MYPMVDNSPQFQRLVSGDSDTDLIAVALEIARDAYPHVCIDTVQVELNALAEQAQVRLPAWPESWLTMEALRTVLFVEQHYRGVEGEFYDPRNCYLNQVLERRIGLPISLAIIYIAVAEQLNLPVSGVNLPGHFIVRVDSDDGTIFLDPYRSGRAIDRAEIEHIVNQAFGHTMPLDESYLRPCSKAAIVTRLLQSLKIVYLRQRDFAAAIPVLKRLALISPEEPEELRDLGIICFHEHRRIESLGYLIEYLRAAPTAADADDIRMLLRAAGYPGFTEDLEL